MNCKKLWVRRASLGDSDFAALPLFVHLIDVTRRAIECEQRAAALARHPLYGSLAVPFRDMAQLLFDAFNELLRRLDEKLHSVGVTLEFDLRLTLSAPPSMNAFESAEEAYTHRFFDSNYALQKR